MLLSMEVELILKDRFGKDSLTSLATSADAIPFVRTVDSFYQDGSFYVVPHALSGKIQQAVCGDWFTGRGIGCNLGYIGKSENSDIARKMNRVFSAWIDDGHNDLEDENTIILQIRLRNGVLFSNELRYDLKKQAVAFHLQQPVFYSTDFRASAILIFSSRK